MKKILFSMLFVLMFATIVICATALTGSEVYKIWKKGVEVTWEYPLTTSVAIGDGDVTFKIPTPDIAGRIKRIFIKTASDNLDVWLSGKDNETIDSVYTFVSFNADGGYSPNISPYIEFYNADTPQTAHLYLTFDNKSATPTGVLGKLIMVFERY